MKWSHQGVQATLDTPLGQVRLCANQAGLAGIWFHDQRHLPDASTFARWPSVSADEHPAFREARRWLEAYFSGVCTPFAHALDLSAGTVFQQSVWKALTGIPAGSTRSYAALAQSIQRPAAVRAVGAAVGRNPVSILMPCHRVIGANGALTGYAGGLDRKVALLRLEGCHA